jgi:hydroxypyruvate isomerase
MKPARNRLLRSSRRSVLSAGAVTALATALPGSSKALFADQPSGRIRQAACKWCYPKLSVDQLCAAGKSIGLAGIDLLQPEEYAIPLRYGMICTMGYAGAGNIKNAMNRIENHAAIEANLRRNIPLAAKNNVPNVITFSGDRNGMSDEQGAENTVLGLNRVKHIAEDHGVTICLELLNSKVDHPDYMADHTAWGVQVMSQVNSPHVKLLFDIYHMQIMEGDLITTIRDNIEWIGHFHTGGVPGRHELNNKQEVQWDGVMRAIAALPFRDYVAHEFIPTGDPITSLRQAYERCNV